MDEQNRDHAPQQGDSTPPPQDQPRPGYDQSAQQPPPGYGRGPYSQDPYERWRRDDRTWAMLCHLAAFAGRVLPLGHIIGPLIVWQLKKNDYPLTDDQGKQSLNFQLSMAVYGIVLVAASWLMMHRLATIEAGRPLVDHASIRWFWTLRLPLGLGTAYALFPFLVGLVLLDVVCTIIAAVQANAGRACRYPLAIPFIR